MNHPEPKLPGSHGALNIRLSSGDLPFVGFFMLRIDPGASLGS